LASARGLDRIFLAAYDIGEQNFTSGAGLSPPQADD
jgi:hypothetical protein